MKKILIIILLILPTQFFGQSSKKGYKSLEKKEYDKAREAFTKDLAEQPEDIGANFGMALVLADDQSTEFNIVDAWQYVEKINGKTNNLTQEEIDIIGEYFLNTEVRRTSYPVKKKIENAIEAIESRLIKYIREENNLEAVNAVLDRYPNFRYHDNVIHIRNQFEFRKFEKQNSIDGYLEFIRKFPDAAQVDKAHKSVNKLAFDKAVSENTVLALQQFIEDYPLSEQLQTAIKYRNAAAYKQTKITNTLESYENFISAYPDALEVADARVHQQELLYEKARTIKSIEAYNDFIMRYPNGAYYVDIFNLKSADLGNRFLNGKSLANESIEWVRGFDNSVTFESGGASAFNKAGECVLACNTRASDTAYSDVWIMKLDKSGKMLWNKTIGQLYDDSVTSVLIDTSGNIIVTGYTWMSEDSHSKMGWMFKLGTNGNKIWNRNLGKLCIHSSAVGIDNRIYLSTSNPLDSVAPNYSFSIYNTDAQKIGQKTYTGKGIINDIKISQNGNILLAGTNWLTLLDSKKYIVWEDTIKSPMAIANSVLGNLGNCYTTGSSENNIFYAGYSPAGKRLWKNTYPLTDSTQVSKDIAMLTNNSILVFEQKSDGIKIKTIASNGSITDVKELKESTNLIQFENQPDKAMLLLNNGDLIAIKYRELSKF